MKTSRKAQVTIGRPRITTTGVRTGVGFSLSPLALKKLDRWRKKETRSSWLNKILENL